VHKAIEYYETALQMAKEAKNRQAEGAWLGNIGSAYFLLGNTSKAVEFYQQALDIDREVGNREGEGSGLTGLGNVCAELGDARKAIEFYAQALVIAREIGDRQGEGVNLSNIASRYFELGENDKSIDFYTQALQNAREIKNKYGEGKRLNGLAGVFIENDDLQNAIKHSQESIQIGQEMSSPEVCMESGSLLTQAYLFQNDLVSARATIVAALQYDVPKINHKATALHGIIALRQGERETAQEAFAKSIAQADEILAKTPEYYSALDAKGLALSGLAIADHGRRTVDRGQSSTVYRQQAIEAFQQARKIAPHAGVVKSVLRLFDELVKCDEKGILKDVRKVAGDIEP
jgi:tetratricopeptide (TPR) repeat protein